MQRGTTLPTPFLQEGGKKQPKAKPQAKPQAEGRVQPCGLHKAYNYLEVEELEPILKGLERAYEELGTAQAVDVA